jgi:hypothetical protein
MAEIMQTGVQQKKSSGGKCCLFGCLGAAVIGIIVLVAGFFGAKHMYGKLMNQYTQAQPQEMPQVQMSETEVLRVRQEWQAFKARTEAGEAGRIELTDDQVNALIASEEDWAELKGRIFLRFEKGQVQGMVSMPLDEFLPGAEGRYLNGEGTFNVSCADGRLHIYMKSLQLGDKQIPEQIMTGLKGTDLAEEIYTDSSNKETVEQLSRIKRLEFLPGRMVVEISEK